MQILLNPDGTPPEHITPDLRADLEAQGAVFVHPTARPEFACAEGAPEARDGAWWQTWQAIPPEPTEPPDPKLVGIEFEGVMCSATSQDQSGLMAVLMAIQIQGARFPGTRFEFENGNVLIIHLGNYQAFMGRWMPFRQSFFAVTP